MQSCGVLYAANVNAAVEDRLAVGPAVVDPSRLTMLPLACASTGRRSAARQGDRRVRGPGGLSRRTACRPAFAVSVALAGPVARRRPQPAAGVHRARHRGQGDRTAVRGRRSGYDGVTSMAIGWIIPLLPVSHSLARTALSCAGGKVRLSSSNREDNRLYVTGTHEVASGQTLGMARRFRGMARLADIGPQVPTRSGDCRSTGTGFA
jgi:hypothetical protein